MGRAALDRARAGDQQAFAELVGPHRAELRVHCYRMLGSLTDAEDLLQETLLAAWQGVPRFAARSSLRTWLYRIATNRCLNAIRDRQRRVPPAEPVPPFVVPEPSRRDEVTWLQPYPDALLEQAADPAPGPERRGQARAGIELAFIAALQRLPPRQTAALVLCDVLGFSIAEVAAMLDTGPTAVKGLLQRARGTLDPIDGAAGEGAVTAAADSPRALDLAQRFAHALEADDVDAVVELLSDDAWLAMPPAPHRYEGRRAIAGFLRASAAGRGARLRLVATRANTQSAFHCHLRAADVSSGAPAGIVVLTVTADRLTGMTRFLDPELQRLFASHEAGGR